MGEIAYVEAHDARVEEVRWLRDGRCELLFAHLAVYHRVLAVEGAEEGEAEAYEVWSHTGRLVLDGVTGMSCRGKLADEPVMDGEVFAEDGTPLRWELLRERRPAARVEIRFADGAAVEVECSGAALALGERERHLERWSGPL